jgi:chemosensory pili system protein ChpA (sensor histidine kinase/response regulator)
MIQDKEREIKLQFLDEAEAYLETLETTLVGISQRGLDKADINSALRAAHSIKGGAGLMGYGLLSDLAHRLEDSLKVLKLSRDGLVVDDALATDLLAAVDALRQIIECDRNAAPLDPQWLENFAMPVFDKLHEVLGEPTDEDAASLLSTDENQDILPILFQTEVESCLERLEGALQGGHPDLQEELTVLAQELGGLGQMLQLDAFDQLCQCVGAAVEAATGTAQIQEVAQLALQSWRQSQALVLTHNLEQLPTQLQGLSFAVQPSMPAETVVEPTSGAWPIAPGIETSNISEVPDLIEVQAVFPGLTEDFTADFAEVPVDLPAPQAATAASQASQTAFKFSDASASEPSPAELDATVRVSVRQLNGLNDYFGELTIERHQLDTEVKRLRGLVGMLTQRLRALDEFSLHLRETYDRTASAGNGAAHLMLPPGRLSSSLLALRSSPGESSSSNSFDALEMDRYAEHHLPFQEVMETLIQLQEVRDDIELSVDTTEQTTRSLQRTARQLQQNLNQLRMQPLSDITSRFPRALRELSLEYGKSVRLVLEGENTLVDRNILESLNDPLMHILRNAFDHGIEDIETRRAVGKPEQGAITIRAQHRNNRTVITIQDDGRGIPLDKIRQRAQAMGLDETLLATASEADLLSLIFEPGFSTATQVTTLSGRGVGMDVVRNNLKQIRGDISVATQAGQGTTFTISVPNTLSVTRVLLAESNRLPIAFPTDTLREITVVSPEECYQHNGQVMFSWKGKPTRLIDMSQWLAFNCPRQIDSLDNTPNVSVPSVLIFSQNDQWIGLQIDRSWGEQEVAVRRVEGNIALPPGFNNCTILGDGRVVPLVSVSELLRWVISCEGSNIQSAAVLYANPLLSGDFSGLSLQPGFNARGPSTVLIIDDSINVRRLLALTLEKQGYQVMQAKDGLDALEKLEAGLEVHAIICDLEMPRLDGYGFLARLRANESYAQIPVTMLTSRSGDKHRQLAMNLGAYAYFSKPYREQSLLATLEDAVRRPAMAC